MDGACMHACMHAARYVRVHMHARCMPCVLMCLRCSWPAAVCSWLFGSPQQSLVYSICHTPPHHPHYPPLQAACLARCNGARVELYPYGSVGLAEFRAMVAEACRSAEEHIIVSYSRKEFLQTGGWSRWEAWSVRSVRGAGGVPRGAAMLRPWPTNGVLHWVHACCPAMPLLFQSPLFAMTWRGFLAAANLHSLQNAPAPLPQPAGDGHFSPIGGYSAKEDLVLILDTARFKYPPHWVPLEMLYK